MTPTVAQEQAIGWVIRLRDATPADWEDFTAWLEGDPAHAAAYDAATIADSKMAESVTRAMSPKWQKRPSPTEQSLAVNDNGPSLLRRHAGLAAALLLCVLAYPAYRMTVPTYAIETALGEHQSIRLDDGTIIDLNGGTRLTLDRRNPRLAVLNSGEARFRVTHDANAPFAVIVGGARVEDVGTIFNIVREGEQTEVAVAEGAVMFNPESEAVALRAGESLRIAHAGSLPVVRRVDPTAIGAWTTGRLDFTGERLIDIGPDLARALGTSVTVDPEIAGRAFTGTIIVNAKDRAAMEKIASLMGVSARRTQQGWLLTGN